MKPAHIFAGGILAAALLMGCDQVTVTTGNSIAASEVEDFFRKHKVDGHRVAALKKRSVAGEAYLATIHGFPNNLSVCEELIAPYNKDPSLSVMPGNYSNNPIQKLR